MLRSLARVAVVATLATGLAVGSTVAADAQKLTVKDQRGDVLAATENLDTGEVTQAPAPEVTDGDILRSVFNHGKNKFSVRVKFADIKRSQGLRMDVLQMVTNEGVERDLMLMAAPGVRKGDATLFGKRGPIKCKGLDWRIDYTTNVVTLSFPRTCASNPRWVKVGLGSASIVTDEETQNDVVYIDDAQVTSSDYDAPLAISKRIRRG